MRTIAVINCYRIVTSCDYVCHCLREKKSRRVNLAIYRKRTSNSISHNHFLPRRMDHSRSEKASGERRSTRVRLSVASRPTSSRRALGHELYER